LAWSAACISYHASQADEEDRSKEWSKHLSPPEEINKKDKYKDHKHSCKNKDLVEVISVLHSTHDGTRHSEEVKHL